VRRHLTRFPGKGSVSTRCSLCKRVHKIRSEIRNTPICSANRLYAPHTDIYVMNADGSDRRQLTNHRARDENPDWSPDGTQIAFYSERVGNADHLRHERRRSPGKAYDARSVVRTSRPLGARPKVAEVAQLISPQSATCTHERQLIGIFLASDLDKTLRHRSPARKGSRRRTSARGRIRLGQSWSPSNSRFAHVGP
jgi:dipeptidyl aminopeptidase/acylaminoacyl peptidase